MADENDSFDHYVSGYQSHKFETTTARFIHQRGLKTILKKFEDLKKAENTVN